MPIGPLELAIVLVIVVLIFGARRLPELGRSLGSGMREFKDGISLAKEPLELAREPLEPVSKPAIDTSVRTEGERT